MFSLGFRSLKVLLVVDIDFFRCFLLSLFILGIARASLLRLKCVLEDGFIIFYVLLEVETLC